MQRTTYTTEYRQQCYNVPKPVCKMRPCQYAVKTQSICPITNQPLDQGPTPCGGGPAPAPAPDMCGACRQVTSRQSLHRTNNLLFQQNVQMCTKMTKQCETVNEKVCQQVPIRVSAERVLYRALTRCPMPGSQADLRPLPAQVCEEVRHGD